MRRFFSGTGAIVLASLLWSTGGLLAKMITADPVMIAAARGMIAGLALAPFIRPKEIKITWQLPLLIFCYGGLSTSFIVSTKLTAAANAIALQSTAPLWVFLATLVFYRKVVWKQALPVGLIAVGLFAIMAEPTVGTSSLGNTIALCSGVFFAVNTKLLQKLGGANSLGLISLCNLCSAPLIWLLVPKTAHFSQITSAGWLILGIMGIFQLGIPYALYTIGLRSTTPQKATMVALIEPTFNPVWVLLFLGEIPSVYAIVGGVFILTGLVVDTLFNPSARTLPAEKKENPLPL